MDPRRRAEEVRLHVLGGSKRSPYHKESDRPRFCPLSSDLRHDTSMQTSTCGVMRPRSYVSCSFLSDHLQASSTCEPHYMILADDDSIESVLIRAGGSTCSSARFVSNRVKEMETTLTRSESACGTGVS